MHPYPAPSRITGAYLEKTDTTEKNIFSFLNRIRALGSVSVAPEIIVLMDKSTTISTI